eukprot:6455049-Amphidinium_carterae.1
MAEHDFEDVSGEIEVTSMQNHKGQAIVQRLSASVSRDSFLPRRASLPILRYNPTLHHLLQA